MFSKTLIINLILLLFILLGTWYTWLQLNRPGNTAIIAHQPDAYATEVIMYYTDKTGALYSQLNTPLVVHYPIDNSLSLTTPLFTFFLKNKELWLLSSRYGKLRENQTLLQLWDHVKLEQQGPNVKAGSTLTTSNLTIHLQEKTAETSAPVTITQPDQEIHAIGLHANLATKTIQLLSQVQGQLKSTKK